MREIKIFLAGSTKTEAQTARDNLRILFSRLQNRQWSPGNEQFALLVHDYKDFISIQEEYNKFIRNSADIFIAVVDAEFDKEETNETDDGQGTYSEFKLACESFLEKGKPEVILLYKTFVSSRSRTKIMHKRPSKQWMDLLKSIGKYAIADTSYSNLNDQLGTEIGNIIRKFMPETPKATPSKYKIGDVYEKDGLKGIVFSTDKKGKTGKIISAKPSTVCSWREFINKKTPFIKPWRVPNIDEIEEIFMQGDTYNKIDKALRSLKGATQFEHDRYKGTYLSCTTHKAFRQKTVRWSHSNQKFSSSDCETSHIGIIRPVADVEF